MPVRRVRFLHGDDEDGVRLLVDERGPGVTGSQSQTASSVPQLIASSEVVAPLENGPEVAVGQWPVGEDEGFIFIGNPDGDDVMSHTARWRPRCRYLTSSAADSDLFSMWSYRYGRLRE